MSAPIKASFVNLEGERVLIAQVHSLMDTMDDDEIADATKLPLSFVRLHTAPHRAGRGVWVRDNKTGRTFRAMTYRGAYRIVCTRGLTDWDFGTVGAA